VHEQILQPSMGNLVLRTYLGTWHRHDFPVFEKAFMHLRQQPFLGSNFSSFYWDCRSTSLALGLYTGSSPLLKKSSIEHPLHPHVWHPFSPISVRRWPMGTTHTQDFLPPSVCLHFRQQYLNRLLDYPLSLGSSLLERGEEDTSLFIMLRRAAICINYKSCSRRVIFGLVTNKNSNSSSMNHQLTANRKSASCSQEKNRSNPMMRSKKNRS
jgi:hypothetical protein